MSLQHILLGCLSKPASGYDLQKEIDLALSHFWSVQLPQIYPTLRRMEEDGLVKSTIEESKSGPQRRVYKRTGKGKETLVDWLLEGPIFGGERRHYLAQIYFLHEAGNRESALAFLEDLRAIMEARYEQLAEIETELRQEFGADYPDALPEDDFFRHLTFDLGRDISKIYADWSARSVERLKQRMTKD